MWFKMKVKFPKRFKVTNERGNPRVDAVRKVNYRIRKPVAGEGFTQNISEGGCCLMLNEELPPGAVIELDFGPLNGDSRSVRALGKVVWQNDDLTGIRFLNNK